MSDDDFSNNDATVEKIIPLARRGTPSEVASLIGFLLSDDSSYVTGSTYHIDGGLYV